MGMLDFEEDLRLKVQALGLDEEKSKEVIGLAAWVATEARKITIAWMNGIKAPLGVSHPAPR